MSLSPRDATLAVDHLFSTPIARIRLANPSVLNEAIYRAAVLWRDQHDGAPKHVDAWDLARGWEIGPNFFEALEGIEPIDALRHTIETCFLTFVNRHHLAVDFSPPRVAESCRIEASWATAVFDNALLADEHIHHGAHFVAVYYVKVPTDIDGRDNDAGYLLLRDPRPAMHVIRLSGQKTVELIRPEEGLLVFMPAYLSHAVRPFWNEGERLSINCNLNIAGVGVRDA